MKINNVYWIIAGVINLLAALLHTISGQIDLINPFMVSNMELQPKFKLLGVWYIVTITLFATAVVTLYSAIKTQKRVSGELISFIGYLYIFFSLAFIIVSAINDVPVLQWILLLPIGILCLIGVERQTHGYAKT